jgi:signal transduction histidine kinase
MRCPLGPLGAIARIITIVTIALLAAAPAGAAPCAVSAAAHDTDLRPCRDEPPDTGFVRHLGLDLAVPGPDTVHRVLDLRIPSLLELVVRQRALAEDGSPQGPSVLLQVLHTSSTYDQRVLPSPRLAVPIALPPGRHRIEVDYRIYMEGRLYPMLLDERTWRERNAFKDMFGGMELGLMGASLLLALMTWTLVREPATGAYALLAVLHAVGLVEIRGDAFAYLWPNAPLFSEWATIAIVSLVMCSHAWFATRFLALRERTPTLYRLHLVLIGLLVANLLVAPPEAIAARCSVLAAAYAVLAMVVILRYQRNGGPDARLYTLGTGSYVFFTIVLFVICATGHNPWPRLDHFVFPEIGYLLETTFLSAALLWRVRQLRARQAAAREQQLQDAQALMEVDAARRAADARAAQRTLMFAGASHDLSQPLASLRLALGALQPRPDQAGIVDHLDRTIGYAQTLLRDVLAQARSDHHAHDDRVMLGECIAHVVREHGPAASAKGLRLRGADTRIELRASSLVLSRLLHNLVSNAVRYTRRGRILVGVRRRAGGVELQVLDTGPGLLPDQLAPLQQPFRQGTAAAAEGHGLGLFVVRTLCQQNGLQLRVATRIGRGSAFCVWIPVDAA